MSEEQTTSKKNSPKLLTFLLTSLQWRTLFDRSKDCLLHPKTSWQRTAMRNRSLTEIYLHDLAVLAAIGPLCQLVKMFTYGERGTGQEKMHWGFLAGIEKVAISYVSIIVGVLLLAEVLRILAPKFSAAITRVAATELSFTAALPNLLVGVFNLLPGFRALFVLGGCYGLLLLWNGMPVMAGVSPEKRATYFGVSLGVSFLVMIILAFALSRL